MPVICEAPSAKAPAIRELKKLSARPAKTTKAAECVYNCGSCNYPSPTPTPEPGCDVCRGSIG